MSRFYLPAMCWLLVSVGGISRAPAGETAADLWQQASQAAAQGKSAEAVKLLNQALDKDTNFSAAYYLRGREYFRLGKFAEAVLDFDKYVALRPDQKSRQWERGIALYYAGEFERGAQQFELYQTFHDNDVENSVWRYLCMARGVGVHQARAAILPIQNDPRVPMMQIYDLYRGKLSPDDVFEAARAGAPSAEVLVGRLFYAHLYLGLFHEAAGEHELAKKHILLAADEKHGESSRINRYMWVVARVHADTLRRP